MPRASRKEVLTPAQQALCEQVAVDPLTGCWHWQGRYRQAAHMRTEPVAVLRGKQVSVQRAVYELWHGPVPPGKQVRNTCQCPDCCAPIHVYAGEPVRKASR